MRTKHASHLSTNCGPSTPACCRIQPVVQRLSQTPNSERSHATGSSITTGTIVCTSALGKSAQIQQALVRLQHMAHVLKPCQCLLGANPLPAAPYSPSTVRPHCPRPDCTAACLSLRLHPEHSVPRSGTSCTGHRKQRPGSAGKWGCSALCKSGVLSRKAAFHGWIASSICART